jgi:urea transporter
MLEWRESNLRRKPAAFTLAHGAVKLVAIAGGSVGSTLSLMAIAGELSESFFVQVLLAVLVAIGLPALVVRVLRPKDDPLIAIGLTTETYALLLLGFAVAFVVGAHDTAQPLLTREGDRAADAGAPAVARAEWFLAGVEAR